MSRSRVLSLSVVLVLIIFVAGAFAARTTSTKRSEKHAQRAAEKAAGNTSGKAVSAPAGTKTIVAYPENSRFFTIQPWWVNTEDDDSEFDPDELLEFDPLTGDVLDHTVMTLDGDPIFGATEILTDPATGDVYIVAQTVDIFGDEETAYEVNSTLGIIDVDTGEIEPLSDLTGIANLAFDASGDLYGITGTWDCYSVDCQDGSATLYSVNPSTGALTEIQELEGGAFVRAIGFDLESGDVFLWGHNLMETMADVDDEPQEVAFSGDGLSYPQGIQYMANGEFLHTTYSGTVSMVNTDGVVNFLSEVDAYTHGLALAGTLVNEVNDGQEARYTIVIPYDGDNDGETYTFECTDGLPDGAVCEFDPDEVTIDEEPAMTTLIIHTDGTASLLPSTLRGTFALWLMLPGVAVVGLVLGRKNARVRSSMFLLLLLSVMLFMPACGGDDERFGGGGGNGDLSLITVTATSDNDTQTFQVALEVF